MNQLTVIIALVAALAASVGINLKQWQSCAVEAVRQEGKVNTAAATAEATAQKSARNDEAASVKASNDVGQTYEEGKRDVEVKTAQFVADLRPHDVELRDNWKGCPASRMPEASATAGQPDAAVDSQRESLKRIAGDMGRARDAAGNAEKKIAALQLYIRTVCLAPAPSTISKETQ
jgi:hypothetical protein